MSKKITKYKAKKFYTEITQFIETILNGKVIRDAFKRKHYEVDTIAGRMTITVPQEQEYIYSIFCRFDDPTLAGTKFDSNKYSGKYNYMCSPIKADTAIEYAKMHLECTQPATT